MCEVRTVSLLWGCSYFGLYLTIQIAHAFLDKDWNPATKMPNLFFFKGTVRRDLRGVKVVSVDRSSLNLATLCSGF
jgi:hypothetical protein